MRGIVKWFDAQRNYGFLKPDDGSPDIFVHIRELKAGGLRNLQAGQAVSFDVAVQRGNKICAVNLAAAT